MELFIKNLPWILTTVGGIIIWLIRLEGKLIANKQKADADNAATREKMDLEFKQRDAQILSIKETTQHLTKMGEDIKGTLNPLLQSVAAMDSKLDILLNEYQKNK